MLLQFNFGNYRSFRDHTSLDFRAAKISEHEETVVSVGNEKVLPVAAIYGANASGKSNVLSAFLIMRHWVLDSFSMSQKTKDDSNGAQTTDIDIPFDPFRFDQDSINDATTFEVFYTDESEKTINYGFMLDSDGIVEEWLITTAKSPQSKPKHIFYRNRSENTIELNGISEKQRENILVSLADETLIVSLGSLLKISILQQVKRWFSKLKFIDYGNIFMAMRMSRLAPSRIVEDAEVRKKIAKYLSSFDKSIVGIDAELLPAQEGDKTRHLKIETLHRMIDSEKTVPLPLEEESDGTQKMFSMYQYIENILESGSILVVDELNARLHPLLVRNLLIAFLDPEINKKHAQILFTSHDAWLLKAGILRRDEIWFSEKNQDGVSTLYSLADFVDSEGYKVRKDADLEKNYLLGKYGAIPSLETLDMFEYRDDSELQQAKIEGENNE